jgi:aspartate/tyrosine/aromatic aminotransferase
VRYLQTLVYHHYITLLTGLGAQWRKELASMPQRITAMRTKLRSELEACGAAGSWNHITDQVSKNMTCLAFKIASSVLASEQLHVGPQLQHALLRLC